MHLMIAPRSPKSRRAARWTIRRRLVCLVTEQYIPGRHRQAR